MKGIKVDCQTGEIQEISDSEPFPDYGVYEEPRGVDIEQLKKLIDYAKQRGWI